MRSPISLPTPLKRSVRRVAHHALPGPHPPLSPYDTTRKGTSEIWRVGEAKGKSDTGNSLPASSSSSSSSSLLSYSSSCCSSVDRFEIRIGQSSLGESVEASDNHSRHTANQHPRPRVLHDPRRGSSTRVPCRTISGNGIWINDRGWKFPRERERLAFY